MVQVGAGCLVQVVWCKGLVRNVVRESERKDSAVLDVCALRTKTCAYLLGAFWGACELTTEQNGGASAGDLGEATNSVCHIAGHEGLQACKAAAVVDLQECKCACACGAACAYPATDGDIVAHLADSAVRGVHVGQDGGHTSDSPPSGALRMVATIVRANDALYGATVLVCSSLAWSCICKGDGGCTTSLAMLPLAP